MERPKLVRLGPPQFVVIRCCSNSFLNTKSLANFGDDHGGPPPRFWRKDDSLSKNSMSLPCTSPPQRVPRPWHICAWSALAMAICSAQICWALVLFLRLAARSTQKKPGNVRFSTDWGYYPKFSMDFPWNHMKSITSSSWGSPCVERITGSWARHSATAPKPGHTGTYLMCTRPSCGRGMAESQPENKLLMTVG